MNAKNAKEITFIDATMNNSGYIKILADCTAEVAVNRHYVIM